MSDAQDERRFERTATATLFLLAVLLHVILSWQYRQDPFAVALVADASSYDAWAARWAAGGIGAEPVFHQSPLFPWWLSWTHRLVGDGWRVATISGLQGLLNALAISLWVPLGRRWFGRSSVGLAAGIIALTFAPFYFHALKLLPVATALATQVVGLLCLSRADSPAPRPRSLLAGALWGLACLARAEMLILALPFALWLGRRRQGAFELRRPLLFLLGLACLVTPATLHNLRQGDLVLVASSAGENLYIGNQRDARGGHHPLAPKAGDLLSQRTIATAMAQQSMERELRPSEVSSFWARRALDEIRADPAGWALLIGRKALRVLHPGDPTDLYSLPLERRHYLQTLYLLPTSSWTLFLMGGIGLWLARRESGGRAWPLLVWIAANALVLLIFFANARLRLPLLFALCGHAGLAIVWFTSRTGRRRMIGIGLLALTILAGFVATRSTPRDVVRLAAVLSMQQRLDASLTVLNSELSRPRPDALVLDQAGWVLQKQREFDRSRERYLQALEGDLPDSRARQTRTRLGQVLERLGELNSAQEQHDLAVSSGHADAGTFHERGMFHARQGRRNAAVADFKQALRLDPTYPAPAAALQQLGVALRPGRKPQPQSP